MSTNCSNIKSNNLNNVNISNTPTDCVNYKLKSFLPLYNGEKYIQIRDVNGIIRYKIYNNTISARYISKNILFLKVVSENKIIRLEFSTPDEATQALIEFSNIYNMIRS